MTSQHHRQPHARQDGLGTRRAEIDPQLGPIEVLELSPIFAGAAAEQAIRSRAARTAELPPGIVAPVYRIDRSRASLAIVSAAIDGIQLSDLLAAMQTGAVMINDAVLFELAASVIRAVAALHELPGGFAHGAIAPTHLALLPSGEVLLTDAAVSTLLQDLQRNREQLWKEFGLAFPPAASLPRFDQRADVTQLGAAVLAILLRRPLAADEYPRRVLDLALDATAKVPYGSPMRMWVQQALQLHPRSVFTSAADAGRAFAEMTKTVGSRRTAAQALQRLARELSGRAEEVPAAAPPAPARPAPRPAPVSVPVTAQGGTPPSSGGGFDPARGLGLLRAVLPNLRAN